MAATYDIRRGELTTYFDRTAAAAWEALTSDAPVSRVRATVRAGRARMRALLLSRLPADMAGLSLLDAGCGTGALAVEAARRGAAVTAVDVSARLIETARDRHDHLSQSGLSLSKLCPSSAVGEESAALRQAQGERGNIIWQVGDMLTSAPIRHAGLVPASTVGLEQSAAGLDQRWTPEQVRGDGSRADEAFDHVVAMDSLIHYREADIVAALVRLAARTRRSILFTVAPRTPLLGVMHAIGKLFPRGDRSPAIEPVASRRLARLIAREPALAGWTLRPAERVTSGFYLSEAHELVRR